MGPVKKAFLTVVIWNLAVRAVAAIGYFILPSRFAPLDFIAPLFQSNFLAWSLANFDGEHYLSIAKFGYQLRNGFPQYAFFPLLPVIINFVATFTRDYLLSGFVVTQTALWVALTYIQKWTKLLKLPDISLTLLVSTGAIFLASVYTESVFIMLAVMTMYFSEKKWWGRAVITTALATATRVNGIFLALFLLVKMLRSGSSKIISLVYSLLSLSGIFGYMLYLSSRVGDPLAWFRAQGAWGKAVATPLSTTLSSYLKALSTDFVPDLTHLVVIFEVVVTVLVITLFIYLLRRLTLDLAYWLYLALNIVLPLATGSLGSMPRFALVLFPLFVVIPRLPRVPRSLYYIFSSLVAVTGIILFTRGYWYG